MIDTESNHASKTGHPETWEEAVGEIPLMRVGQPIDCGNVAVFLASDVMS